jgi:3-oxoacyl-[acyl-carrier-protein] synthase-3
MRAEKPGVPLRLPAPRAGAGLLGLGAHRPARVVTNDELCVRVDSDDTWIRERTGIRSRRYAGPAETVVSMAAAAGAKALAGSGIDPAAVDLVILASCTQPRQIPGGAPELAQLVGATGAGAMDLVAACAGFCYGLAAAADAIRAGSATHVLVAGSERFSDVLDPADRGTAIIFGDGAAAAVLGPSDAAGIGPICWGADGSRAGLIETRSSRSGAPVLTMDGPAVFRWAVTAVAPIAREACRRAGIEVAQLAGFIPHQANLRIVDAIARGLDLPEHVRVARDIVDDGNTSAASIPSAFARMVEAGELASGDPVLLVGFGAGLTYAAQVVLTP